jgi:hypothetical protein
MFIQVIRISAKLSAIVARSLECSILKKKTNSVIVPWRKFVTEEDKLLFGGIAVLFVRQIPINEIACLHSQ